MYLREEIATVLFLSGQLTRENNKLGAGDSNLQFIIHTTTKVKRRGWMNRYFICMFITTLCWISKADICILRDWLTNKLNKVYIHNKILFSLKDKGSLTWFWHSYPSWRHTKWYRSVTVLSSKWQLI